MSLLPPPPPLWSDERSRAACEQCVTPLGALLVPWCAAIGTSLQTTLREWQAELPSIITHARAAPPLLLPAAPSAGDASMYSKFVADRTGQAPTRADAKSERSTRSCQTSTLSQFMKRPEPAA